MTIWLWLLVPVIAIVSWFILSRRPRKDDLGSVSAQWLHEYAGTPTRRGERRRGSPRECYLLAAEAVCRNRLPCAGL